MASHTAPPQLPLLSFSPHFPRSTPDRKAKIKTNPSNASRQLRFTLNTPRPTNPLEAIKFICKDLWLLVFRKQIDNLKTNHRGIFVLTDTRFQPISRMSIDRRAGPKAAEEAMARAVTVSCFLFFSLIGCGCADVVGVG